MIVLIILGAIAALIVIMLLLSVTITVDYENELSYRVSYAFISFLVSPESEKAKQKRLKRAEKQEKKEKKQAAKAMKKNLGVPEHQPTAATSSTENKTVSSTPVKSKKQKKKLDIDLLKRLITNASPHAKRIFKKIRVYDVYIDIVVGGDDAAKVAIGYGTVNMLVNSVLCVLNSLILLKVGEVNIEADFDKQKSDYFAHCKIKLRLCTLLHSGIRGFLAVYKELNKASSPAPAKVTKAA